MLRERLFVVSMISSLKNDMSECIQEITDPSCLEETCFFELILIAF